MRQSFAFTLTATLVWGQLLSALTPLAAAEKPTAEKLAARKIGKTSAAALRQLRGWRKRSAQRRSPLGKSGFADVPLTRRDAVRARDILWSDYVILARQARAAEMKNRELVQGKFRLKFAYRIFGSQPKNGRSLYISMHGGGGAPKRVNDQQWENQKRLYRPQEGVYVAPRAPTDTWNMWHQAHIDPLFDRLIQDMVLFENVDPNRVYLMGYSAGGDGAYQLAPRMADRWAAVAMMAGHPNDTSPLGLRNIGFTIHVGEKDAAYSRNQIAKNWQIKLAKLKADDPKGYPHFVKIHRGLGHWMLRRDAVAVPWMAKFTRTPLPKKIVWKQDDVTHSRFYWLAVSPKDRKRGALVIATRRDQHFEITAAGVSQITLLLNDAMLNLDKPFTVVSQGRPLFRGRVFRTIGEIAKTIAERGDRELVFSARVTVTTSEKSNSEKSKQTGKNDRSQQR